MVGYLWSGFSSHDALSFPILKSFNQFSVKGLPPNLTDEQELAFYRIAQEALNNAMRHADAETIRLELIVEGARTTLRVCDDGKGFAVPTHFTALTQAGHFGLMGMRERAILVEGAFAVVSAPEKGTQVTLTL